MNDKFLVRVALILGGIWLKFANITGTYFMQFQIPHSYWARTALWSVFVCGSLASASLILMGVFPNGFPRRRPNS